MSFENNANVVRRLAFNNIYYGAIISVGASVLAAGMAAIFVIVPLFHDLSSNGTTLEQGWEILQFLSDSALYFIGGGAALIVLGVIGSYISMSRITRNQNNDEENNIQQDNDVGVTSNENSDVHIVSKDNNQEQFDDIINKFSLEKHNYNIQELQRIKTRSAQILGFLLVIISIIFAGLSQDILEKLLINHLALGIFILGLIILIVSMALSFRLMIKSDRDPIIDPEMLDRFYRNHPVGETMDVIRNTMFSMLREMDTRNNQRHHDMWTIYWVSVSSLVIIFIPMMWAISSLLL